MPTDASGAASVAAAPREMRHFIARAREIAPHAPLPAYYCRLRAVEVGMALDPRPAGAIDAVLNTLERTKRSTPLGELEDDFEQCKSFAYDVYDRADRVDRAGGAHSVSMKQVDAFSAASTFLAMLEHFEEHPRLVKLNGGVVVRDNDRALRKDFAEWRAFDLRQALSLGKAPTDVRTCSAPPPPPVVVERRKAVAPPPPLAQAVTAAAPAASAPPPPPPPPPPPQSLPKAHVAVPSSAHAAIDDELISVEDVPEDVSSSERRAGARDAPVIEAIETKFDALHVQESNSEGESSDDDDDERGNAA